MTGAESGFESLGVIIARTSVVSGNARQAVEVAAGALAKGKRVGVFLISDGVWNALEDSGWVSETLTQLMKDGGRLYVSEEHARAAGLPRERVIGGAEYVEDTYKTMVEKVMESWDKVIIC